MALQPQADGIVLDLDRAIHLGLIVNELVTNALKHAFLPRQQGEVVVALSAADERVQVQVRDNGRGLPEGLDLGQAKSLGLRTVHILARRLEGEVRIERERGTSFTLRFPAHAEAPREPPRD